MAVAVHDCVRFRTRVRVIAAAGVRLNSLDQVAGPAVVQEEDPLTQSPQRSGSELIGACAVILDDPAQEPGRAWCAINSTKNDRPGSGTVTTAGLSATGSE